MKALIQAFKAYIRLQNNHLLECLLMHDCTLKKCWLECRRVTNITGLIHFSKPHWYHL